MKVAVIPARGGSKRIPRKNIKLFCGKPMIAWSIEAAQASGCFDRIIVSTDDEEIATVSRQAGAEVPFMRPPELADDSTGTMAVMKHAIEWCSARGIAPDPVCCIYATAPFLRPADIQAGLDLLLSEACDYVFAVANHAAPIQRALRVTATGRVEMFHPEYFAARSQDLEPAYHDAAQFYWGRAAAWAAGRPVFSPAAAAMVLPRHRVQDIDTPDDWTSAEGMFSAFGLPNVQQDKKHG